MRISEVLRTMFEGEIQEQVAARLTACGMRTDQTKVSAWLRGRVPNLEQMNAIEDCYQLPHGTILVLSGFVDLEAFREVHDLQLEGLAASATGTQFAVAAEGSTDGRPPKKVGPRVTRPQPRAETG